MDAIGIVGVIIVLLVLLVAIRTVRIVPQAKARNVERLGRYRKTLEPGLNLIIPVIDRVKPLIDLREQVVSFLGQPVITEDNLVVKIDTVLFFQVTDPRAADYEIVDYIQAIEQLTATMLRSVIGSMDLERSLTSRDEINTMLRGVLDDASGKWGIRVTRVEIKAIDPPLTVKEAMEKQMRAEREKRAAVLNGRGRPPVPDPDRRRRQAERDPAGRGREAGRDPAGRGPGPGHHHGVPSRSTRATRTPSCWPTSTCRPCPSSPRARGNTVWMIPSELTGALKALGSAFGRPTGPAGRPARPARLGRAAGHGRPRLGGAAAGPATPAAPRCWAPRRAGQTAARPGRGRDPAAPADPGRRRGRARGPGRAGRTRRSRMRCVDAGGRRGPRRTGGSPT